MSVEIIYKDIAVTAKDDSTPSATDKQSFVDMNQLKESDLEFTKYSTLEDNFWLLDGSFENFPDDTTGINFGYWSNSMSDGNGVFATPPVVTILFSSYETSVGIMIKFNTATNDYCNSLNIKWYQDTTLLDDKDFTPDSTFCFCQQNVTNYNKVVITFNGTNKPYRYIKQQDIQYGVVRTFQSDELKNVKVLEEMSLLSEQLSINTLDFTLDSTTDTDYIFQKKQPLTVNFNSNLIGTYYIDNAIRKSANQYDIEAIDQIGLLDKITYLGGIYNNVLASTVIANIMGKANVPYELASSLSAKTIRGYIPICTCRQALMHIVFAIGAVVDTSRSNKVKIFELDTTVATTIASSAIYTNPTYEEGDKITGIQLVEHTYTESTQTQELYNGSDTTATVIFNEPMHNLSITGGTITESGVNYAIITKTGASMTLTGQKYTHTTKVISRSDPTLNASDLQNILDFLNCYLVNSSNSTDILNRLYEHYITNGNSISKMKIVFSDTKTGDTIEFATEYLGNKTGEVVSMNYGLNSSKLVADVVIKNMEV